MKGPAGRSFFTRSVQKVLMKAKLIAAESSLYGKQRDNESVDTRNSDSRRNTRAKHGPDGWKDNEEYDAMGKMINRIRSLSTKQSLKPRASMRQYENDEVFIQPPGRSSVSLQRASVIKNVVQPDTGLQHSYNIPVSNLFSELLN